jgi:hypothetical protein
MEKTAVKKIFTEEHDISADPFIPLHQAFICPECDLIRKGPGACACGNSETVPAMRALTHPEDRPPIVSFRAAAIRVIQGGAARRKSSGNILRRGGDAA